MVKLSLVNDTMSPAKIEESYYYITYVHINVGKHYGL